jgi:hypothetical protein
VRSPLIALLVLVLAGCGSDSNSLPQGAEPAKLDAGDFVERIDNPYWPMAPGSTWVYREDGQRVEVTVTDQVKEILGIRATVVHDVVTEDGEPIEVTDDRYAQDSDGNIWYMGEHTTEYESGRPVSTAGSFEAGVDGAQAGIAMPANPSPGLSYRQEYYKGVAEDKGAVVTVGQEQVEVPFGHFTGVLMTRDLVPLEPKVQELKFFARDVGPLLSVHTDGTGGRAELVSYSEGG